VAAALLPHLEARVRQRLAAHPVPQPSTLTWWIAATNAPARQAAATAGYDEVRHMWGMLVELGDAPPAEPRWPAGIVVRPCATDADRRAAHAAVEDAFHDHWGHTPRTYEQFAREWIYADGYDPALWFLAVDEASGEVVGTAVCESLSDRGWVGDLAVRRAWRGRGLGMALLRHAFRTFHARGQRRVGLGVDSQNLTGATRLYERAGMRVERQYDVFQKPLEATPESTAPEE
jgi:mycothiol synthase